MRICAGTEYSSWKYLRCWTDSAPRKIQTVALDPFLRTFLTRTFKNYKVYFSRASGSGMRPVHRVVRVLTHCSEAWKRGLQRSVILTCWEHTSQKHQSSQEGTRRNQICKMLPWDLISLHQQPNEDRLRETVCHFCLSHKTAETTEKPPASQFGSYRILEES